MPLSKNLASKATVDPNERAQRLALVEQPEAAPLHSDTGLRLFRPEVLAERQTQYLGTVLLAPRLSDRLFTLAAVVATAAILGLLFYGDFTRKARINGWLVPQEGLVRVFAPQPGVVTGLFAREGAEVHKGERRLTLSAELQSSALGATQAEVAKRLVERRAALRDERSQRERLLAQQQRGYGNRLAPLG